MAKTKMEDVLAQIVLLRGELDGLKQQQQRPAAKKALKGQPRTDVYYVLSGIPTGGLPPQAIACARILATALDTNDIPEVEAKTLIEKGAEEGRLKTDQDPWYIFRYYRAKLIRGKFLLMKQR